MEVWSLHYQATRKCWQLRSCARLQAGQPSMLCAPDHGRTVYLSDDSSRMRADWQVGLTSVCTFLSRSQLLSDSSACFWLLMCCHQALASTCSKLLRTLARLDQFASVGVVLAPDHWVLVCRWT